jgi:hypothetical protein
LATVFELDLQKQSDAESVEQISAVVARFQRAIELFPTNPAILAGRRNGDVRRLWRLNLSFQTVS